MTLIGLIGGGAMAALFSGWLESILYGISRDDPATIAGVALLMGLVTGVATYIPARRAASVEPTVALREWLGGDMPRVLRWWPQRAFAAELAVPEAGANPLAALNAAGLSDRDGLMSWHNRLVSRAGRPPT